MALFREDKDAGDDADVAAAANFHARRMFAQHLFLVKGSKACAKEGTRSRYEPVNEMNALGLLG